MKIYISGFGVVAKDEFIADDVGISFQKRSESDTVVEKSVTGTLKFRGAAYKFFLDTLINNAFDNATENNISVTITLLLDCCRDFELAKLKVLQKDVNFCEYKDGIANQCDIEIKASVLENDNYECLATSFIDADTPFRPGVTFRSLNFRHPIVRYCTESRPVNISNFMTGLYVAGASLLLFFIPVFVAIFIILAVWNTLATALNNILPGSPVPNIGNSNFTNNNPLQQLFNLLETVFEAVVGCGKGHLAPYVRDFISNVCLQCNLTQNSHLFNNPNSLYYNTAFLSRTNSEGEKDYREEVENYFKLDSPAVSGMQFLDKLLPIFNHFFYIKDNELIIEPKNSTPPATLIDFRTDDKSIISDLCYSKSEDSVTRLFELKYREDLKDIIGNEAARRYNDVIDTSVVNNDNKKGFKSLEFDFSPVRFREDGIRLDITSFYSTAGYAVNPLSLILPVANAAYLYPLRQPKSRRWLLMSSGANASNKLLVLGNSRQDDTVIGNPEDVEDACVIRKRYGNFKYYYNYLLWFDDTLNNSAIGKDLTPPNPADNTIRNIYLDFWQPVLSEQESSLLSFNLVILFNCEIGIRIIRLINVYGLYLQLFLPYKGRFAKCRPTAVEVKETQISISGNVTGFI
jgi:hypothetical protein